MAELPIYQPVVDTNDPRLWWTMTEDEWVAHRR
jgi:hypothetical protein